MIGESMVFDIVFTDKPVIDHRSLLTADGTRINAFNAECLRRGVCKGREKLYMPLAHSGDDIAKTLEAFGGAPAAQPMSAPGTRA